MNLGPSCSAVITGASQGIGKAIAEALSAAGVRLVLTGRSMDRLQEVQASLDSPLSECLELDLASSSSVQAVAAEILESHPSLDVLINCAGAYFASDSASSPADRLDELAQVNVKGPSALTRALMPALIEARGDVVFINSSIVNSTSNDAAEYASTKRALRDFADSLRNEVNENGVRVLSVYPGRTATPLQQAIHAQEDKHYDAERLLQPEDIAELVIACLRLPDTAEVTDIHIRPKHKS